ncbi:MAG: hypothetical protein ACJ8J0_21030, partial [Longimicrobiaceae bacterium]
LAMPIGGEYRMRSIERRHWERLADSIGADRDALVELVADVVERIPDTLHEVCSEATDQGFGHPVLLRLQQEVEKHVSACRSALRHSGLPREN